jgi:hypothetical protein
MANQYTAPDLENFAFDFSRAEINLNRKIYTAFSNVSHNQPLEEGVIRGTKAHVLKRTRGAVGIGEGSLEFSDFEEAVVFTEDLGDGWAEIVFPVLIIYTAPKKTPIKYELLSCRLLDHEIDHGEGADGLPATLPFSFMRRKINGKEMLLEK